ncbi:MAG: hypothetical protein PSV24_03715 [Rhodoferax sp.]|nr:hypothetical protein [Rhodoferax sp.]
MESGFPSHDYNPRESLFYETFQKIRFTPSLPGRHVLVGGALVIGMGVASAMVCWPSGWGTR